MSDFYSRKNSNVSKLWFVVLFAFVMMLVVVWKTHATIVDIEGRIAETEAFSVELLGN